MKLKVTAFWLVVLAALFIFLQEYSKFHFFFIEQSQLFQFTGEYISEKLAMPGGFALTLSEFLVQFFIYPYAGAGITAGLLLLTGLGMRGDCSPDRFGHELFPALSDPGCFNYVPPF